MSGIVRTVRGDIGAVEIGHTQTHEHLLVNLSQPLPGDASAEERARDEAPISLDNYYATRRDHTSHDLRLESVDDAVAELQEFKAAGGSAVVDATSNGIERNPQGLLEISERTGVHVVMGSGYYYRDYHPQDLEHRTATEVAGEIVADIEDGVGSQRIRAGIIGEIGMSWPHDDIELTVLRGAVEAQQQTGAALLIHPARDPGSPFQVIEAIENAGGDPERVIMSHIDRTLFDDDDIRRLADTGCYLEFDLFGQEMAYYSLGDIDMPNDAGRIDHIARLINAGHRERVLIAQDICHKTSLRRYGGEGYAHILRNVLPMMRRKGLSDIDLHALTIENPRRALALRTGRTDASDS